MEKGTVSSITENELFQNVREKIAHCYPSSYSAQSLFLRFEAHDGGVNVSAAQDSKVLIWLLSFPCESQRAIVETLLKLVPKEGDTVLIIDGENKVIKCEVARVSSAREIILSDIPEFPRNKEEKE